MSNVYFPEQHLLDLAWILTFNPINVDWAPSLCYEKESLLKPGRDSSRNRKQKISYFKTKKRERKDSSTKHTWSDATGWSLMDGGLPRWIVKSRISEVRISGEKLDQRGQYRGS